MAYLRVHSLAVASYLALSALYKCAISLTRGSSGLGSHNNEQIDSRTLLIVSAGDHWSFRMSKQIEPLLERKKSRVGKTPQENSGKAGAPVDVGMVDARREGDLRRLERIVRRKMNVQEKHAALVRALAGPHDCGAPVKQIIANRAGRARRRRILQRRVSEGKKCIRVETASDASSLHSPLPRPQHPQCHLGSDKK